MDLYISWSAMIALYKEFSNFYQEFKGSKYRNENWPPQRLWKQFPNNGLISPVWTFLQQKLGTIIFGYPVYSRILYNEEITFCIILIVAWSLPGSGYNTWHGGPLPSSSGRYLLDGGTTHRNLETFRFAHIRNFQNLWRFSMRMGKIRMANSNHHDHQEIICKMVGTSQATCVFLSSFSILLIAIDRYLFIVHPNFPQVIFNYI